MVDDYEGYKALFIATRHYTFGTSLGRESFAVIVKDGPDVDDRDTNQVVGIFRKAQHE